MSKYETKGHITDTVQNHSASQFSLLFLRFCTRNYVKLLRSLKLRADKAGAVVTPSSYEDEDSEMERRLDQYYTEGLAAFYTEDWDKACQRFQLILSERPNHKGAVEKLEESERRRDLSKLYKQSIAAYQVENWQAAITFLDELLKKSPNYKDADQLSKNAKKQKQLNDLYAEAKKLHASKKWLAVLKVFDQILSVEPNHPDPDGLLPSAQKEMAEIKRLSDLNDLYSQAVREMDLGKWYEARELLEQVHKTQTGFLETEHLLRTVENEILKIEEISKRNNQVNTLYEQAHGLIRSKNWRKALDKIEEIQKLDSQFEDKDGIAEKIKLALEHEELDAQKQNQLAAMYTDAVRLLKDGKYQDSLEKWNEVKAIDSKYPDRQRVQRTASKKLVDSNKGKRNWLGWSKSKSFRILGLATLFVLVAFAVAGFAIPIKFPATTIEIPGKATGGFPYQVPLTGYYTFRYVDSAYDNGANSWNTGTTCYSGRFPWQSDAATLFTFESGGFSTKEAAINSTHGMEKKVHLVRNEWINCVVDDYYFLDNSGEIILNVYYSFR